MPAAQRWDVGSAFTVRPPLSFCLLAVDPWVLKKQRDLSDREIFTIDGTDLLEGESHSRRVSCGLLKSTEVAERRLRLSLASRICEQCSTMVLCIWSMQSYWLWPTARSLRSCEGENGGKWPFYEKQLEEPPIRNPSWGCRGVCTPFLKGCAPLGLWVKKVLDFQLVVGMQHTQTT